MKFSLLLRLLILTNCVLPCCAWAGTETLSSALQSGDPARVDAVLAQNHANKAMIDLFHAMLRMDYPAMNRPSRECIIQQASAGEAMACARLRANWMLTRGDMAQWVEQITWVKNQGLPPAQDHREAVADGEIGGKWDHARMQGLPLMTFKVNKSQDILPVIDNESHNPIVEMDIGGQRVRALVDTGTGFGLTISERLAHSLGLSPFVTDIDLMHSGMTADTTDANLAALAIVPSLQLGPLAARDYGVIIASDIVLDNIDPASGVDAIIGLPLLSRFKWFSIGEKAVRLAGTDEWKCQMPVAMRVGSDLGGFRLLIPIIVDNVAVTGFWDTGLNMPLVIHGEAATQLKSGADLKVTFVRRWEGTYAVPYENRQLSVALEGYPAQDMQVHLQPDDKQEFLYTIGIQGLSGGKPYAFSMSRIEGCIDPE